MIIFVIPVVMRVILITMTGRIWAELFCRRRSKSNHILLFVLMVFRSKKSVCSLDIS